MIVSGIFLLVVFHSGQMSSVYHCIIAEEYPMKLGRLKVALFDNPCPFVAGISTLSREFTECLNPIVWLADSIGDETRCMVLELEVFAIRNKRSGLIPPSDISCGKIVKTSWRPLRIP